MYNIICFRVKQVLLALLVGVVIFSPFTILNAAEQSSGFSLWGAIVNFFGFGSSDGQVGSDKSQNTNENIISGNEILNSDRVQGDEDTYQPANEVSNTELSVNNSANIICIPGTRRKGEPAIVWYSCPKGAKLKSASFNASYNSGVLKLNSTNEKEYIDCQGNTSADQVSHFECNFKLVEPSIDVFTITPTNPEIGQEVSVRLKTSYMQNCSLSASSMRLRKYGTDMEFGFTVDSHGKLLLNCIDDTMLNVKREISY